MGLIIGFFKLIIRLLLWVAVLIAFILLIPNLPPYTKFTSIKNEQTLERSGSLAPNEVLNNAKHLYKDKLMGPECFQEWNDEVYTSLATGEIVKLSRGGHVTFVTKIGQPCTGIIQEHICGRPLGFVIDEKNKDIIVADAYHGIWKVNLQTDKKQLLVSPRVAIDGKLPMLFNSVALANNGDIYWTDSSSEFHLKDAVFAALADPSGRLLYYNAAKNESKVLLDDLWFPNGLAVSPDNEFVVVAESNKYKLFKYYINGPLKGKSEIFAFGLPGIPDNVRPLPDGSGVLVGLYEVFDDDNPLISKSLSEAPLVRKFASRLFRLIEIPFEFLQTHFNNHVFESIVYYIGNLASVGTFSTGISGLVQIDWNGIIVASYYNTDGNINHISDAIVFKDQLYTASPHLQDYVAAVPAPPFLKKAFTKTKQPKTEIKTENKPSINEPKEVPKTAKPVQKSQPSKADKPIEKNQDSKQASQTKPPPAKQPELKNTISKEPESKPKVTTNQDKDSKPDVKPKVVSKDDAQPKSKETATKPKVEPKGTESKPKVVTKDENPKKKASAEKPKVIQKEPEKKPQAQKVDKKPVMKETSQADKAKPKADNVKQTIDKETASKLDKNPEKAQVKPVKVSEPAKPVPKADEVKAAESKASESKASESKASESKASESKASESKASESKSQPKPKKVKEEPRKAIPIEEEIPSDTKKPSKEKLKVIKKSGPQEIPNPNL